MAENLSSGGEPPEFMGEFPATCYEFDVAPLDGASTTYVRWGGRESLKPGDSANMVGYHLGLIKYCIQGRGVLYCDGQNWEVEPDMVIWAAPRKSARLVAEKGHGLELYSIALWSEEALADMRQFLQREVGSSRLRDPGRVSAVVQSLMEEGQMMSDHRLHNCELLGRLLLKRIDMAMQLPREANLLARQTFSRCREYIERRFATLSSLREVAEACDVTVPYLCRLFYQFLDKFSPYEYLTWLKMMRAESLLIRTTIPVRNVALAVGYKDARLFTRNFKAQFGVSPSQFRSAMEPPPGGESKSKAK